MLPSKRLAALERAGMVERRPLDAGRGFLYIEPPHATRHRAA
jgi:hypothetical protein